MLIVHDAWTYWGGAERLVSEVALIEDNNQFLVFKAKRDEVKTFKSDIKINNILKGKYFILNVAHIYLRIWKAICRKEKIFLSGNHAIFLSLFFPTKNVMVYVHSTPKRFDHLSAVYKNTFFFNVFTRFFLRYWYRCAINAAESVFTNSLKTQSMLSFWYGRSKVNVIWPPVMALDYKSPEMIEDSCSQDLLSKIKNFLGDDGFDLSIGRIEQLKQIDKICSSYDQFLGSRKLIVASDGRERQQLEIKYSNVSNVLFLGYVPDTTLLWLMMKSDVILYIPIEEDFGMSLVEALAYGSKILVSKDIGAMDYFRGEDGIYAVDGSLEPFDLAEWVRKVGASQYDPSNRRFNAGNWNQAFRYNVKCALEST